MLAILILCHIVRVESMYERDLMPIHGTKRGLNIVTPLFSNIICRVHVSRHVGWVKHQRVILMFSLLLSAPS